MLLAPAALSRLPQPLGPSDSPTFTGARLTGLAASRLLSTDSLRQLSSVPALTAYIAGTANRVTVADDGDGTLTLSAPQDIHASAMPAFRNLTLNASSMEAAAVLKGGTSATTPEWAGLALKRNVSGADTEALVGFYDRITVSEDYAGAIGSKRRSTTADYSLIFKVKNATDSLGTAEAMRLSFRGNLMLGGSTDNPGSATRALVLYSGTAPSSSVADAAFLYSADHPAGSACLHSRTEAGHVIKLFRQSHIADPAGGSTVDSEARAAINAILAALEATGLLATT